MFATTRAAAGPPTAAAMNAATETTPTEATPAEASLESAAAKETACCMTKSTASFATSLVMFTSLCSSKWTQSWPPALARPPPSSRGPRAGTSATFYGTPDGRFDIFIQRRLDVCQNIMAVDVSIQLNYRPLDGPSGPSEFDLRELRKARTLSC